MGELTQIMDAIGRGDRQAAGQLLPQVYDELRRLAAQRLAQEAPGQSLDPSDLVHEAYVRLVGDDPERPWDNRGHFFAAAAEAMRRILVEKARKKRRKRHGGGRVRVCLDPALVAAPESLRGPSCSRRGGTKLAGASGRGSFVNCCSFAGLPDDQEAAARPRDAQTALTTGPSRGPGSGPSSRTLPRRVCHAPFGLIRVRDGLFLTSNPK